MRAFVALLMTGAVLLAGCQSRREMDPTSVGVSDHHITVDGRDRTYQLYVPSSLPPGEAVPLVVVLHGGFGTGSQARGSYGWDAQADGGGFVVAYPDGLVRAWAVGGGCCGRPGEQGVDDVAFIEAMVARVGESVRVDPARVYATGISNGGLMSYRLACDTTLFAAIGPVAATRLGACEHPAPVSVIHVHGDADHNIALDGSPGDGFATIDGPPVPEVIDEWRAVDGCGQAAVSTDGPVTTSRWSCPNGRAVELIVVAGAGHQWPGSVPKPVLERALGLDPPATALDATAVIWDFFAVHPKAG
ncbi:extracellular catalytic domain type 1 short-chain-length polyhydroxyalkanoate depolymerase [Catellatospora tritici]|uniref:extracellular catalytic domain type 1 short-chain-length polyhydroxyalkanoate depolymerase n=1 Tax=Catellatospora tritici TaxID=2851566 RepID=UPI001C2D7377|nr:PHB depolymerase family esterase [Catellatospora tritici]MBV1853893.1 polyhydroxybutyrate depolymerase [Catellatospora tritici]